MQDSDVTLKAVWKENQAAPDEPTAITADVRTITLDSPQDGVEYILVPHGQTPTDADWTSAKTSGGGTEIVFDRRSMTSMPACPAPKKKSFLRLPRRRRSRH